MLLHRRELARHVVRFAQDLDPVYLYIRWAGVDEECRRGDLKSSPATPTRWRVIIPLKTATLRMTSFRIVDFDASTGAMPSIEYKATSSGFNPQTISGVIACQMTSEAAGEGSGSFRQVDGFVYAFSGDGQSSGGDGAAHIEGVLGLDGSILFDFSGDYTPGRFVWQSKQRVYGDLRSVVSSRGRGSPRAEERGGPGPRSSTGTASWIATVCRPLRACGKNVPYIRVD